MAGKVFFSVTMSLDGFIAPEERMDDQDVPRWTAQWTELQQWIFPQRFFGEDLKLGEGGEEGRDNDIVRETFERSGASVMAKRRSAVQARGASRKLAKRYLIGARSGTIGLVRVGLSYAEGSFGVPHRV